MVGARKEVAEENSFYPMSLFGTCQIKAYPYSQGLKKILCQEKAFDFPDTLKLGVVLFGRMHTNRSTC